MKLYYEWGMKQLLKHGEELCGDRVSVTRGQDSLILALSDGLGSGVKANILATLTTEIVIRMLEEELPLDEVVRTLTETLPVCDVRKLAYSTFAIAQFFGHGSARVVEFDSPQAMVLRNRTVQPVAFTEREIEGKTIQEAELKLQDGDWVVFVSDGVLNAGIGGVYPLGWGWEQAARFVEKKAHRALSAVQLADRIADAVGELYAGRPGDDVSVAVIKVRHKLTATLLTGPPADPETDAVVVKRFYERGGSHAVCGGTTAKIVSRHIGRPLEVDLGTITSDVPPVARIQGIDLVSEGILTLTRVNQMLSDGVELQRVRYRNDGAAALLRLILDVDHVHFMVGQAVNPAHQNPDLPQHLKIRQSVVREIAEQLIELGKEVTLETV